MVCYEKCEEKETLGETRIAKNEKLLAFMKLAGGKKHGKGFNRS